MRRFAPVLLLVLGAGCLGLECHVQGCYSVDGVMSETLYEDDFDGAAAARALDAMGFYTDIHGDGKVSGFNGSIGILVRSAEQTGAAVLVDFPGSDKHHGTKAEAEGQGHELELEYEPEASRLLDAFEASTGWTPQEPRIRWHVIGFGGT